MIKRHLVAALCGTAEFRLGNHALLMGEGGGKIRHRHAEEVKTALGESRSAVSNPDAQCLGRIQRTGAWLLMLASTVNGTKLGAK